MRLEHHLFYSFIHLQSASRNSVITSRVGSDYSISPIASLEITSRVNESSSSLRQGKEPLFQDYPFPEFLTQNSLSPLQFTSGETQYCKSYFNSHEARLRFPCWRFVMCSVIFQPPCNSFYSSSTTRCITEVQRFVVVYDIYYQPIKPQLFTFINEPGLL